MLSGQPQLALLLVAAAVSENMALLGAAYSRPMYTCSEMWLCMPDLAVD